MTDKPTPKEIDLLVRTYLGDCGPQANRVYSFVTAVLAKWGSPVVAGDVARADAVNLARNALTQYDCAITKKGVRVLAEAVLSMDSALTPPGAHPCAGRGGDGFWETACGEAWRFDDGGPGENNMHFCHSCGKSLRIKGGQHVS